jgi:molybdopterin-binding protein
MVLFTVRAAARQMGIGYSTLKGWIRSGKVRSTHTAGGHHRLSQAEIDRLLVCQGREAPAKKTPVHTAALVIDLSQENHLRGFVEEVRPDGLLGQIRLQIGDQSVTALVTCDALEELKLKRGDDAVAIIKATGVMIARERTVRPEPKRPIARALARCVRRPRVTKRRHAP